MVGPSPTSPSPGKVYVACLLGHDSDDVTFNIRVCIGNPFALRVGVTLGSITLVLVKQRMKAPSCPKTVPKPGPIVPMAHDVEAENPTLSLLELNSDTNDRCTCYRSVGGG